MRRSAIWAAAILGLLTTAMHAATTARPAPLRYLGLHRLHDPRYHSERRGLASTTPSGSPRSTAFSFLNPAPNDGFFVAKALSVGGESFGPSTVGDFNGDGNPDIAVIISTDYGLTFSVAMLPGNGDGTFGTPVLTSTSYGYSDLLYSADLNGDGKDDVILVHSGNAVGSFDVFLSNGTGGFTAPVTYSETAANPAAFAAIDLNSDGKPDIVIADGLPVPDGSTLVPSVSTLLNNGDGTFTSPTRVPYPGPIASGVFADVNGDGKLDLVSNSQVIFASASGGYQSPILLTPPAGQSTCSAFDGVVAVADVNSDSHPDIVTADCQNDTVTAYLNNGNGTFNIGVSYWAGYYPQGIAIGDLNGDGKPDLAVTNAYSADCTVLLGNGDGSFQSPVVGFSVGGIPWAKPVLADFDKDSKLDLISASYVPDISLALTYLRGLGDGTFAAALDSFSPQLPAGQYAVGLGIASADFNGDGKPDIVVGNSGSNSVGVTVFLDSSAGLRPGINYGSGGNFNFVATGDFNGDSKPDIVASNNLTGDVDLFLGNGDGTFASPSAFSAGAGPAQGLVAGDFNGDGKPDVAVVTQPNNVVVLINNGTGGFNAPVSYFITSVGSEIAVGDLNNDGILDLVIPQSFSNFASVLLGNGDGTFTTRPDFDLGGSYPASAVVGDWNGDGKNDIAVTIDDYNTGMGIAVALGNGDGTFQSATLYPTTANIIDPPYPGEIAAADVNHDGSLDLVYVNSELGTVGVLYGTGLGTFGSPNEFPAGTYPYGLIMADVNGDGVADAVTPGDSFPGVTVLLNSAGTVTSLTTSPNPSLSGQTVTFTASVAAAVRGVSAIPTGIVTFYDHGIALGTGTLISGQTMLSTSGLSVGSHSLTASYSSDPSFFQSASTPIAQIVNSGPSPSYYVSASPTNATIRQGQSANFTLTLNSVNGYQGTVAFSCGSLPLGLSCQFNPPSLMLSGGPVQSILTVSTSAAAANHSRSRSSFPLWATGFFGLIVAEGLGKRNRMTTLAFAVGIVAMLSMAGCGASSSSSAVVNRTQTLQVFATGVSGGNAYQQVAITLTIEP